MGRQENRPTDASGQNFVVTRPAGALPSRSVWIVIGAIVVLAAIVRIWAAQDEFWLDEIWSLLAFGRAASSPLDVFTFHHDNNHYLVTLWMYFVGAAREHWFVYRVPSLAAGIGTVILAAWIARRWGSLAAIAAAVLTGGSFVLITYASEARGYALAGFFALTAFLALDKWCASRSPWAGAAYALSAILGTLAHLTFVEVFLAAIAWSAVVVYRTSANWRQAAAPLGLLHAVPLFFLLALYLIDVRGMRVGGGSIYLLRDIVPRAAALAIGSFAQQPVLVWLSAIIALGAVITGIYLLARETNDVWVFFACAILVAPALLLVTTRPTLIYERYFYLNLLFALLLFSFLLSRLAMVGAVGRTLALLALLLVTLGNARMTFDLLRVGRGHYLDLLHYLAEHSTAPQIQLITDGDFDNEVYLGYYVRYLPPGRTVTLYRQSDPPAQAPEWIVLHGQEQPYDPPPSLRGIAGAEYVREAVFPCAGLSGYSFAVYHRADARGSR